MMSQRSKRELIEAIRLRYLKANRAGKKQILDEFIATTGYHRKYSIRVLRHGSIPRGVKKAGGRKIYQGGVVQALEQDRKSMVEFIPRDCTSFYLRELKFWNDAVNSVFPQRSSSCI